MMEKREQRKGEYALWHGATGLEGRKLATPERMLVEGQGIRVRDAGGRWYLDSRSSLRTVTLGYSHPIVLKAVRDQLNALPYAEIVRYDRPSRVAVEFADELTEALPDQYTRIRLTTSGSRMLEEALILTRFMNVSGKNLTERTHVIANTGAWHGLGGLASAATGDPELQTWAGPLVPGLHHVPPNDIAALEEAVASIGANRICAVLLEPINGVAAIVLDPEYMQQAERICRAENILLIADEVTTGTGRTGYLTYCDALGVKPDILVLGKGLSSGYVPVSALALTEDVYRNAMNAWPIVLPHSSTNDGNPLAMAAGLAVLQVLKADGILERVRLTGSWLGDQLSSMAQDLPCISWTGGTGYMHFINLSRAGEPWARADMYRLGNRCEDNGLLIDYTYNHVILTPPLIAAQSDLEEMLSILTASIKQVHDETRD